MATVCITKRLLSAKGACFKRGEWRAMVEVGHLFDRGLIMLWASKTLDWLSSTCCGG